MSLIEKIYNDFKKSGQLKYPWLLGISMILFAGVFFILKLYPEINLITQTILFGAVFCVSFVWAVINYISHIKMSAIYQKNDSIEGYVNSLTIENEDKEDLITYLTDFANDLEANGKTKEEAVKYAIAQFQIEEFTSMSIDKGLLEFKNHNYLFVHASILIIIAMMLACISIVVPVGKFLFAVSYITLTVYAVALFGLFFLYVLINKIAKKIMIQR